MRSLQIQARNFGEWLEYEYRIEEPMALDDESFSEWLETVNLEPLAKRYGEDVAKRDLAVFKFDNRIE